MALHHQTTYRHYLVAGNGLPVSEMLAREVISPPMHRYVTTQTQDFIVRAVREY